MKRLCIFACVFVLVSLTSSIAQAEETRRYKLTDDSLKALRAALKENGIDDTFINKLLNKLQKVKDNEYIGEGKLIIALQDALYGNDSK